MNTNSVNPASPEREEHQEIVNQLPDNFTEQLGEEVDMAGGEWQEDEEFIGAVGRTMYDTSHQ